MRPGTVHVSALLGSKNLKGRSGNWDASVTVRISNDLGATVSGATVTGTWSGAWTGSVTGTTGADGLVTFGTGNMSVASVTFTVDDVQASGMAYEPDDNEASTITIQR